MRYFLCKPEVVQAEPWNSEKRTLLGLALFYIKEACRRPLPDGGWGIVAETGQLESYTQEEFDYKSIYFIVLQNLSTVRGAYER